MFHVLSRRGLNCFTRYLQTQDVVQTIARQYQRRVLTIPAQNSNVEERLVTWLSDGGMEHAGVRIGQSSCSGRGLFSTRDFMKGEEILRLPMDMTIMVYPRDQESTMQVPGTHLPDTVIRLAAKLLRISKRDHSFDPYVDYLPIPFPNPTRVLSHLPRRSICHEALKDIVQFYEETVSFLMHHLDMANISEDDIRWALAVIQSRSFGNGMGQEILVPFVDLMNHGDLHTNEWFPDHPLANVTYGWHPVKENAADPKEWRMVIRAKTTILEGEEFFVSYGDHSNEFFLLYYGFVPFYNPRDEFVLFSNLDDILEWFFWRYPARRGSITEDQLKELKQRARIEGEMAEIVKLNLCADGAISPIMVDFFTFLNQGSIEAALKDISLVCQQRLQTSHSILDDLRHLMNAAPPEDLFFESLYISMKQEIKDYRKQCEGQGQWIEESIDDESSLVHGSIEWWCILHETLKKRILWEFLLEYAVD